jgi:hypothetical protein
MMVNGSNALTVTVKKKIISIINMRKRNLMPIITAGQVVPVVVIMTMNSGMKKSNPTIKLVTNKNKIYDFKYD